MPADEDRAVAERANVGEGRARREGRIRQEVLELGCGDVGGREARTASARNAAATASSSGHALYLLSPP